MTRDYLEVKPTLCTALLGLSIALQTARAPALRLLCKTCGAIACTILLIAAAPGGVSAEKVATKPASDGAPAVKLMPLTPKLDFGPKPLQGSLKHSEVLPAVKKEFKIGTTYDATVLPKLPVAEGWYWIPDWRAGTWQSRQTTVTLYQNFKTGEKRSGRFTSAFNSTVYKGFQKDSSGHIWEYMAAPYGQIVDGAGFREVQLISQNRPVYVSSQRIVMYLRGTTMRVDSRTKKILANEQWESLQTFAPAGANKVTCAGSTKFFDAHGRQQYIQKNTATFVRTAGFKPIDKIKGKDLRSHFRTYLTSHGLKQLVPGK